MRLPFLLTFAAPLLLTPQGKKLQIFATTTDLRDLASTIGGPRVEAKSPLVGPEDPHFIEARPSFIKLASKADLYIKNGMSLEIGYEPLVLNESRNRNIQNGAVGYLDVSSVIAKLEVPTGVVDRSQGDVHFEGNPHYMLDPRNARAVAELIRDSLTRLDHAHKTEFDERCASFCATIDKAMFGEKVASKFSIDLLYDLTSQGKLVDYLKRRNALDDLAGWASTMAPLSKQPIVTYHQNLTYFQHRFGLERVATVEPKPGIQPSSDHIEHVVEVMRARKVKAVFMNVFHPKKPVEKICAETGAKPVVFPHQVNSIDGTGDYVKMIDKLVNLTASALAN